MSVARYAPGNLTAAVGAGGVVVLGEGADVALAAAAWNSLRAGAGVIGIIEVLAADGPLAALPDFVIAIEEGSGWRVAVRGALAVAAVRDDEPEQVAASGSPWAEKSVPDAAALTIGAAPGDVPLFDGVAHVGGLTAHRSDAPAASDHHAAPAAAAKPSARVDSAPAEPVQPHSVAEVHRDEASSADPAAPTSEPGAPSVGDAPGVGDSGAMSPTSGSSPTSALPTPPPSPPAPAVLRDDEKPEGFVEGITDSIPDHLRPPMRTDPAFRRPIPGLAPESATPDPAAPPAAPAPADPGAPSPISFVPGSSHLSIPAPTGGSVRSSGGEGERVSVPAPPAAPTPAAGGAELEDDLEATIMRSTGQPVAAVPGDHDGETISLEEARRLRDAAGAPAPAPAPPPPPAPVRAAGQLRLSTGQLVLLDRPVVIGRRPRSARVAGTDAPHLVSVPSPEQDISRNHVEIRTEGDSILATDLNTTNGTTLLRRGAEPVRLHPAEPTMLVVGDVLDLGDDVRVTVEAVS